MIDLEDISYFREFQNNDSIPLAKKYRCPYNTILCTGMGDMNNVILYCVCCRCTVEPQPAALDKVKELLRYYEVT